MSMPTFVDDVPVIDRDDAITQLIASIALGELSLSHILNAEGEKIQLVLGTLVAEEGQNLNGISGGLTVTNLIDLNNSVAATLEAAGAMESAMVEKLQAVLAAGADAVTETVQVSVTPAAEDPS